jgi:hypothetical protein
MPLSPRRSFLRDQADGWMRKLFSPPAAIMPEPLQKAGFVNLLQA